MSKNIETLVLPALRGRFGDWIFYSCLIPLKELGVRVSYADDIHQNPVLSEFIQRSLEGTRATHIAEYLEKTPDRFFNSLVLAVYGGAPEWLELGGLRARDESLRKVLSDQAEESVGFLQLTGAEAIFAVDGQHRLAGIKKALEAGTATPEEQVPVLLIGHKKSLAGMQRTRRLFTTLNKMAVPVRKRDIIALDEDDVMAITVRRLVEHDDRFKSPRIAIVASQNIPPQNQTCLTTISSLYDTLKLIFVHANGRRSDRGLRFNRPTDERLQFYFEFANAYFSALSEVFKPVNEVFTANDPSAVTSKYRSSKGGHLLFRPLGLDLFTRIAIAYANEHEIGLPEAVRALKKMPMDLNKAPFIGVIWDPARQVMKSDGKTVAREVMSYMVGLSEPTKVLTERYRTQQGYRKGDATIQLPPPLKL